MKRPCLSTAVNTRLTSSTRAERVIPVSCKSGGTKFCESSRACDRAETHTVKASRPRIRMEMRAIDCSSSERAPLTEHLWQGQELRQTLSKRAEFINGFRHTIQLNPASQKQDKGLVFGQDARLFARVVPAPALDSQSFARG